MPAWLGVTLAGLLGLVATHRVLRHQLPAGLMAAGMAVMSVGMAGLGPHWVHGPWWAAGFAVIALWPLARPLTPGLDGRTQAVGHLPHLLGGVAMIYMCVVGPVHGADPGLAAGASGLDGAAAGHAGSAVAGHASAHLDAGSGAAGGALALVGWALVCYFLLGTVSMLTRRSADRTLGSPRLAMAGEAVLGFGTVIMLAAMT